VGLQQGTLNHRIETTGGGVLAFSDGTVIPDGTNSVDVLGPVDDVYPARVDALIRGTSLISAVSNIEDTRNSQGLSLTQAGISATVVGSAGGGQALTVTARQDEAGLPIRLQLVRNASYSISFTSQASDQSTGSVRIFSDDATRMVLQKGLPTDRSQHVVTLHFTAPIDAGNLWLYLYVEGSNRSTPAAFTFSQLSGTVSETLASQPAATEQAVDLTPGPNVLHPSDQDSLVQDMVIAPKPQSRASGNPCAQIPRPSSGLWLVDRHSADGWWQLDAPGASRSRLSANGIGAVWYVPHSQINQVPSLTYPPEALFATLSKYLAAILILLGAAFLMSLVSNRLPPLLPRLVRAWLARLASVRFDSGKRF